MKQDNKKSYKKWTNLQQGDVVLADYGKLSIGGRNSGLRPSVVVSNAKALKEDRQIYVIPLFRKQSKTFASEDILIKQIDCNGLRYDEYAQAKQMQVLPRYRIVRRIGHIRNESILFELSNAIWDSIERTCEVMEA